MRTPILMAAVAIVVLFLLNPEMEDFVRFAETRSEEILLGQTGDSALGRALSGAGAGLAGSFVDRVTERRDYFVFSTYTIDFDGGGEGDNTWRFLGIGGQFIELERPAALEEPPAEP